MMQVDKGDSRIMKNKNKSNKRIALIIAGVVFLCLAVGGAWYYYNQYNKNNNPNQDNPITEADTNPSSNSSQDAGNTSNSGGSNPQSVPGSVTITTLAQDQDGVVVGTIVNGISKGTCTAVFEKAGSSSVQDTAPLGLQVSYYTCKGFNPVAIGKFSQKGEYNVYVKVTDGSTEVRSNAQAITIN